MCVCLLHRVTAYNNGRQLSSKLLVLSFSFMYPWSFLSVYSTWSNYLGHSLVDEFGNTLAYNVLYFITKIV